ncbi:MAG: ABC transporter permease subunit [Bacilli bacterium]|nr:ABC transporter permease subunit [Bacilli bacterium]
MKKFNKFSRDQKIIFYHFVGAIILFFLWWMIAAIVHNPAFPTPIDVTPTFFSLLGVGNTYAAIGGTFFRLLIAFLISFAVGAVLGTLGGYFYRFDAIMKPIVGFFRALPTAAVMLIIVALVNPVMGTIIITTLIMFPIIYAAFKDGVVQINKDYRDKMKMDNVTLKNSFFKIYMPLLAPYTMLGISQAVGLGLKVSVMSEVVGGDSGAIAGLGRLIIDTESPTEKVAYCLITILIIIIIDILLYFIKRGLKIYAHRKSN